MPAIYLSLPILPTPFARPRNVIGGHVIATFTGLVFMTLFGIQWWSMAMAVGTAIAITT
ncbi:HPP family protein [Psychrobacter pacificensis]|uniref:HPP family protein n=1 Tax=Psychrobacter pacificensis TaxID=112002 RepID=UPI0023844A6A|nr:HPP family protein [Psychrobacter pacificensis]MDE0844253.1 HPP family protein [Psychrobacter pacificensis]